MSDRLRRVHQDLVRLSRPLSSSEVKTSLISINDLRLALGVLFDHHFRFFFRGFLRADLSSDFSDRTGCDLWLSELSGSVLVSALDQLPVLVGHRWARLT